MTGKTLLEHLPPELWLDFFAYLNTRDQLRGFFDLNKKINQFLLNSYHHIHLKCDSEDSQCLIERILPRFPQSKFVSSLRLENTTKMNLFQNVDSLRFPFLRSLTLCQLYVTKDLLDLLRSYGPHLQYLDVGCSVGNNWPRLLETILALPSLQVLRLYLSMMSSPLKSLKKSPVKHLVVSGSQRFCSNKDLIELFDHLPTLTTLQVECHRLQCNSDIDHQITSRSILLSSFSLKTRCLPSSFTDFMAFMLSVAPRVQKLRIQCCEPLLNVIYVNVHHWVKLIDSLYDLNELILVVTPAKRITEKAWNRRCGELMRFTMMRSITLRIVSSKESC